MSNQAAAKNIVWHEAAVNKEERHQLNGHRSCVLWFTGLSGSGKSTVANAVQKQLHDLGKRAFVLDGDNIRHGLNKGLGFSDEDRIENIRRIGEVAKLFVDAGTIAITAFISPFIADREKSRNLFDAGEFIEVYVKCPLEECEKRDPKGLYVKARNGQIPDFTGISSPYEEPVSPEIIIDSADITIRQAADQIVQYLYKQEII